MTLSLAGLPGIAQDLSSALEHVIPIHRRCATKLHRDRGSLAILERTLRHMRAQGYEVDLYLQGTFRPGRRGRPRVLDMLLEGWQLTPHGVHFDPPLGTEWEPLPALTPRPTFVVRGYRLGSPPRP